MHHVSDSHVHPGLLGCPTSPTTISIWVTVQEADDLVSQNLLCPHSLYKPRIETPTGLQRAKAQEQMASLLSSGTQEGSASTTAMLAKALNVLSGQNSAQKAADRCWEHIYRDGRIKVSQIPAHLIPRHISMSPQTCSQAQAGVAEIVSYGVSGAKTAGIGLCHSSPCVPLLLSSCLEAWSSFLSSMHMDHHPLHKQNATGSWYFLAFAVKCIWKVPGPTIVVSVSWMQEDPDCCEHKLWWLPQSQNSLYWPGLCYPPDPIHFPPCSAKVSMCGSGTSGNSIAPQRNAEAQASPQISSLRSESAS